MPQLFIILLKINLVLLLFAATYYLVLRRLTFYTLNRCFLVFGIVFSSIYPFIDLTEFFSRPEVEHTVINYLPQLNQKATDLVPSGFFINNWPILSTLFYLGVAFMALRLAIQFISLYRIHRKSNPGKLDDYRVRLLSDNVSPFSFWQTVYINPKLHTEKELDTILAHEMVHVRQWHSLDIILAELSVVFYWFNPGVWLMKKAVKENLEFITDQNILKKGIDRKAYQYSLLGVGQLNATVTIVNNFNLSDLKKRIKMMNVKPSSRLTLSRYAFALPVLLLGTLAFTVSKREIKAPLPKISAIDISADQNVTAQAGGKATKPHKALVPKTTAKKTVKDTLPRVSYIFDTFVIKRDSLGKLAGLDADAILAADRKKLDLSELKIVKNMGAESPFVLKSTDTPSIIKIDDKHKVVINVKSVKRMSEGAVSPAHNGTVVIKAIKRGDSLMNHGDIQFMIDGKAISSVDVSKLKPDEIRRIQINRRADKAPEIAIELKNAAGQ
jgi:hypothetical protein